ELARGRLQVLAYEVRAVADGALEAVEHDALGKRLRSAQLGSVGAVASPRKGRQVELADVGPAPVLIPLGVGHGDTLEGFPGLQPGFTQPGRLGPLSAHLLHGLASKGHAYLRTGPCPSGRGAPAQTISPRSPTSPAGPAGSARRHIPSAALWQWAR